MNGKRVVYQLVIQVTQPVSGDPHDPDYPTIEGATSRDYRRAVERDFAKDLKRLQWDADVELTGYTIED